MKLIALCIVCAVAGALIVYSIGLAFDDATKPASELCIAGDAPGSKICVK